MNTPAHLIFGAAAFARPDAPRINIAALAGSLAPDLSLYLMVGWHLSVLGTSPRIVFNELYFSEAWMQVFAIDNSFILWGILLWVALLLRRKVLAVFAGAGLLHLAFDFPLHHDDGRPQFWPLTDWIFESPVSYWDPGHHGTLVGALETSVCLVLLAVLWRRFHGAWTRSLLCAVFALQLAPVVVWAYVFAVA
ncbi:MAG: cobalamin biosynthesis protein CobQ [Pseudomonadota bacterium]